MAPLLTVREVASRLGLKPFTVYKLCDQGALPFVRIGGAIGIAASDLARLVASRRSNGP